VKVTKYPQSCLLLEKEGRRIVIDPGNFFAAKYNVDELGAIEVVLYTHQHADHYDGSLIEAFRSSQVALYGNSDVAALIGEGARQVQDGEQFSAAGFSIVPRDLPHCVMPDGSAGPPNTGYVIDGNFFHPGDGIEISGLRVEHAAVPIAGPSVSLYHAVQFATSLGAKKVIPIHYDNTALFPGNPDGFAKVCKNAEVIVLKDGQTTEL